MPRQWGDTIAWLVWRLGCWRDTSSATISGEPQIWVSEGWAERCGMPADRLPTSGGLMSGYGWRP